MVQAGGVADRYRWVILALLWTTYIVVFLNRLSVGPLAPFLKHDLGINSTQVGVIMSAASFGYMLTIFPIGMVVDRIGARWPIVTGELIAGMCMTALFFTTSYIWLLMLMFVTGMGCGFLLPATTQGVMAWFPLKERATVMGFKQTAVNLGGILSAAALPSIALAHGWRYGFLSLGIVALGIAATSFILYKEPPIASSSSICSAVGDTTVPLLEILKSREIWLLSFFGLCFGWVEFTVIAHLVLYLTEALLFGVVAAGGTLAIVQAAGAITRPGSGFLSDRIFGGKRKPILLAMAGTSSIMCLLVGLFGSNLSWALYPIFTNNYQNAPTFSRG